MTTKAIKVVRLGQGVGTCTEPLGPAVGGLQPMCDEPVIARGKCSKHYQRHRRAENGDGRPVGQVKTPLAKGESAQVCFRMQKVRKTQIEILAGVEGVEPADLYREAVELLIAKRTEERARKRARP